MSVHVAGVVHGFFQGKDTDEDILNYVVGCLEDDGFEYGKEGEEIFETVGMMLVRLRSPAAARPAANQQA